MHAASPVGDQVQTEMTRPKARHGRWRFHATRDGSSGAALESAAAKRHFRMSQIEYVWVFNGDQNRYPNAVFLSRRDGEVWISANRLAGTLTKYPVGVSVYDWGSSQRRI
jgi:hypothetical protein